MAVPYASLMNPQSLNLYSYVNNHPLSATDPDGHSDPEDPWDSSGSQSSEGDAALLAQSQNVEMAQQQSDSSSGGF